jgi:dihydrodipicolinate synthase/N-acetylneuraminate lyase
LPFYLYEYADRSGYAVPAGVVEKLRERAPNLAGMKVSDAPLERVEPYLSLGLDVFIGAESVIPQGLERGAAGAVSGVAAAFPEAVSALVRNPAEERLALVRTLRASLSKRTFQASVKEALRFRGLPVSPDVRAPLRPLPAASAEALREELRALLAPPVAPSVT